MNFAWSFSIDIMEIVFSNHFTPLAGEAINLKSSNPKRSIVARGSSEPLQYVDTYGKVCSKSVFPKIFLFVYLLAKMYKKIPKS